MRLVRQLCAEWGTDHGTVKRVAGQLGYGVESVQAWVRRRRWQRARHPHHVHTTSRELKPSRRSRCCRRGAGYDLCGTLGAALAVAGIPAKDYAVCHAAIAFARALAGDGVADVSAAVGDAASAAAAAAVAAVTVG